MTLNRTYLSHNGYHTARSTGKQWNAVETAVAEQSRSSTTLHDGNGTRAVKLRDASIEGNLCVLVSNRTGGPGT